MSTQKITAIVIEFTVIRIAKTCTAPHCFLGTSQVLHHLRVKTIII